MLIPSMKASQVLVVPKNVEFSIPRCEPEPKPWTPWGQKCRPIDHPGHNHAKGKEGYPSLGFQCILNFNRRILGVYDPQFGSTNTKQIVKTDSNVRFVRFGSKVAWRYWDERGRVRWDTGMYLICDNRYLRWKKSIYPYMAPTVASSEGYFSSNLESVRKDVE
jgi:hypothetical protein